MIRGSRSVRRPAKRPTDKKKTSQETQKRRARTPWLDFEIQNLIMGVYNFGAGKWAIIHNQMSFQQNRTYIDLKDKWRNLIDHRHCARTAAIYHVVASILQKEQQKTGHIKPDRLLTKNDWQTILQMFYTRIQDEIENSSSSEGAVDSSPSSDEVEYNEVVEAPHKFEVTSYPVVTITKTVPHKVIYAQMQPIQPVPVVQRKFPTIQDLLW